jgi:hypothetical protein
MGELDPNSKIVRYNPINEDNSRTDTVMFTIKTLRLDISHVNDMPLTLFAQYPAVAPATGLEHLANTPLNLTELIMGIEEPPGTFPFRSQDPIDRRSAFDVEINVLPVSPGLPAIRVRINDWDVTSLIPIT